MAFVRKNTYSHLCAEDNVCNYLGTYEFVRPAPNGSILYDLYRCNNRYCIRWSDTRRDSESVDIGSIHVVDDIFFKGEAEAFKEAHKRYQEKNSVPAGHCGKCKQERKVRQLFMTTYVGCMC